VAHNILLAHAKAVKSFRDKFQPIYGGKIGITLNSDWAEPLDPDRPSDVAAAERYMDFMLGWFAHPVFLGDYPAIMRDRVGPNLPRFTPEEIQLVLGSHDFFGLNHYTSVYVTDATTPDAPPGWLYDSGVRTTYFRNGIPIGPRAESEWLYVVPWGFQKLLRWIKEQFNDPDIYVTENGVSVPDESNLPLEVALNDTFRVNYYADYLRALTQSITVDNVKVRGYFAWSLMDNFEWADGYAVRFGIHYVDYKDNLKRYVKNSARFYANFIANASLIPEKDSKWWYLAFFVVPAFILLVVVVLCNFYEGLGAKRAYERVSQN